MRILHAIHDFLPRHRAGSEIYAYELARGQRGRGHEVHLLAAEYDASRPHATLDWRWYDDLPVTEVVNNWTFHSFAETYRSPELDARLEHVLAAVSPDVLHVHNLLNLSFALPALAAARGVPSVATLHDYTLLCPSGGQRVHRAERHVCFEIDTERCARCFPQSHFHAQMAFGRMSRRTAGLPLAGRLAGAVRRLFPRFFDLLGQAAAASSALTAADVERRLAMVREQVFAGVQLFVAPSPALAGEYRRFGLPDDKIRVSDYGFVPFEPRLVARPRERLRLGFVGTLAWHKGAHVVIEAARRLPAERFELLIFGSLDTFPAYAARLREAARGLPVSFRGGFDRDRVADIYAEIDVLVVASLWPENSPLVIHEAYMAGVPVVGARMGGIADLVSHGSNGLLYDAFSAQDLAAALASLIDDPGAIARFAAELPAVKSIDEDAGEWDRIYEEVLRDRRS